MLFPPEWGREFRAGAYPIPLNSAPATTSGRTMAKGHATLIPQLLAEHEQELLRDWMEFQKKSGTLRSGQISEAELGEASRRLLSA